VRGGPKAWKCQCRRKVGVLVFGTQKFQIRTTTPEEGKIYTYWGGGPNKGKKKPNSGYKPSKGPRTAIDKSLPPPHKAIVRGNFTETKEAEGNYKPEVKGLEGKIGRYKTFHTE